LLRQPEERKLNKKFDTITRKAAVMACLFLFSIPSLSAQEFRFDSGSKLAYKHTLNLRFDEARKILSAPKTPQELYVISLAETFELILTEDERLLEAYEANADRRKNRNYKKSNADELLLQTEMYLQWTFIYLKFGRELDAALQLRQAYLTSEEIRERFPNYKAILKTAGLLNVMIGSVPEKYNWILSLLNMEGSVPEGLSQMQALMNSSHDFAFESTLWYAFIQGFVLQQPEAAIAEMDELLAQSPDQPIATFLNISFLLKNSRNEDALKLLTTMDNKGLSATIPYIQYLKGETLLHKGDYENAVTSYQWFMDHYKGQNFLKDACYKMGLCQHLLGNSSSSLQLFHQAKTMGVEHTEADRNAARALTNPVLPPVPLIRVRYLTDGGYYAEARELFDQLDVKNLSEKKWQVEYYYRLGRLAHKTGDLAAAKTNYLKTIQLSEDAEWYFAPNACLQLGYIFMDEKNYTEARKYFEKSMSYKRHEYKNSIDSKARSALGRLNGLK
jgi:tetratricopeptide (TPR) repeat protein